MKIAAKIQLSSIFMVALVLLIGVVGHREITRIGDEFDDAINHTQPVVAALQDIRFQAMRLAALAHGHSEASAPEGAPEMARPADSRYAPTVDALDEAGKRYRSLVVRFFPAEVKYADPIFETIARLRSIARELEQAAPDDAAARQLALRELADAVNRIFTVTEQSLEAESEEFEEYQIGVDTSVAQHRQAVVIGTAIALLAGLLVGVFLSRHLSRPIVALRDVAAGFGAGNLDLRAAVGGKDEIGELAHAFNGMAQTLGRTMISRHHVEIIIDCMAEGVLVADCAGQVQRANQAARDLLAEPGSELVGAYLADLLPGAAEWLAASPVCPAATTLEIEQTAADGGSLQLHLAISPIRDAGQTVGTVLTLLDIGERKRAESETKSRIEELRLMNQRLDEAGNRLLQSEKMAAIGQLAAGVAHEINNPLGFVNSNLGTLHDYLGDLLRVLEIYELHEPLLRNDHRAAQDIDNIRRVVELDYVKRDAMALLDESKDGLARIRKIVQELKDFSRSGSKDWQLADLNAGIDSTLNIVWSELKYKATIVKEYGQLPPVECLPSELNQVFMNLLVNAAHAISHKGTITIRTAAGSEEVTIEVADDGKGIAPEHLSRIFEPFFTTKPVGQGTGLGLSLSYGIVQKHRGRIDVESLPGQGSRFCIHLPIRQAQVATHPEG